MLFWERQGILTRNCEDSEQLNINKKEIRNHGYEGKTSGTGRSSQKTD